jgi:hypothetical protein
MSDNPVGIVYHPFVGRGVVCVGVLGYGPDDYRYGMICGQTTAATIHQPRVGEFVEDANMRKSAWDTQVGGSHYNKYAIQPTEYIIKNNLPFCEGNVIKYVTRWKDKGGVEDLKKARHYLDLLIENEEIEESAT